MAKGHFPSNIDKDTYPVHSDSSQRVQHNGVKETLTEIRAKFWIILEEQISSDPLFTSVSPADSLRGGPFTAPPVPLLPSFRGTTICDFGKWLGWKNLVRGAALRVPSKDGQPTILQCPLQLFYLPEITQAERQSAKRSNNSDRVIQENTTKNDSLKGE